MWPILRTTRDGASTPAAGKGAMVATGGSEAGVLAGALREAHDRVLSGVPDPRIRDDVAASWQRSLEAGVDPESHQPRRLHEVRETVDLRRDHVLAPYVDVLRDLLADESPGGGHLVVVTDVSGEVLWRLGSAGARRAAERIEFVEGADWSERGVGTNAISHAIVLGRPTQLLTGEHLVRTHHEWVCTATPIRHAGTGDVVGVLDVSSPLAIHYAGALPLVRMGARLVEEMMRADLSAAGTPTVPRSASRCQLVRLLGPDLPTLLPTSDTGGGVRPLTLRRAEILALLASRAHGWTADELAVALYGDDGVTSSVRVEMHRIRAALGDAVTTSPYRLVDGLVDSDVAAVRRALAAGDAAAALSSYTGRLLPASGNLEVELERTELHEAVRRAVLSTRDPALVRRWVEGPGEDDVVALRWLVGASRPGDTGRPLWLARLRRVDAELGAG